MKKLILTIVVLFISACHSDNQQPGELDTKSAYSVLQSYEMKWRDRQNSSGIVIVQSALGTTFDIVGIPISGQERGFAWLILNPANPDEKNQFVRIPADAEVELGPVDLKSIEERVQLSPQAKSALLLLLK